MDPAAPAPTWEALAATVATAFRTWRQAHPLATFSELEEALDAQWAAARAHLLSAAAQASPLADLAAVAPAELPRCAACAAPLQPRGRQTRRLRTTFDREVLLTRSYGVCPACGQGFFPPG